MHDAQENKLVMELVGWFMEKRIGPADSMLILTKALVTTIAYLSLGKPSGTFKEGAKLVTQVINECAGEQGEKVLTEVEDMLLVKTSPQTLEC